MKEATSSRILSKLAEQEKAEGNLPLLLEFYRELVQLQTSTRKRIVTPEPCLDSEAVRRQIQKGAPLLGHGDFALDWPLVQETFEKVSAVFARYPGLFSEISGKPEDLSRGRILTKKAVAAWFTGKEFASRIPDDVSEKLMSAIIQATLQPFLASYSEVLTRFVDLELWRRGYCPICGGSPDMASLKGESGARWLLCSRCDTEWLFQRLECPYCGTQEQDALAFFTDEKEQYRLYVCERCKCYLKAVDLRKIESESLSPLERLYTIDLDNQAVEKGYHSCHNNAAANT